MKRLSLWLLAIVSCCCATISQAQTDLETSDQKTKTELKKESVAVKENEREEEEENKESELKHRNSSWYKKMQKPNANYLAIKKSFDRYFSKHHLEHGKSRETGEGWLKSKIFYLDKKGRVQDEPALTPSQHAAKVALSASTTRDVGSWRMLGPVNSTNYSTSGYGNRGGYVFMNRIDPTNSNKMFISFLTGGLWMTSDGGTIWTLTDTNMPDNNYLDLDVAISNPSIVYAISKTQVIKSINGGLSWTTTALNSTSYSGVGYDIAVSRTDPNVVLAKWDDKMYRTNDGGTTWTTVLSGLPKEYQVHDCSIQSEILDWSTTNTGVLYYTSTSNDNKVNVYRSSDSGLTFSIMTTITLDAAVTGQIVGWAKLLLPSNNSSEIYVAIGTGASAYAHYAVQLYKLNNTTGAEVLKRVNMLTGSTNETGIHHGDISMDRTNENKIVYGTYLPHYAFYSSNNGATFSQSATDQHSDFRSIDMVNSRVIVGTDGESELSTDSAVNFSPISNSISNHELWGFGSAFKSDIIAAGLNHGPAMIREAALGYEWYNLNGADQGNTDVNPLDDRYVYSQGYGRYRYFRTGVHTWIDESNFLDLGGIYDYYNNIEFHPNLYYSMITHHSGNTPTGTPTAAVLKNSLIKTVDNGASITVVNTFLSRVFREKVCMTNPNIIYVVVGITSHKLWKTIDGGTTWTNITPSSAVNLGNNAISDIAIGDSDPNQIWVSYSGVQTSCKVLKSADGGTTWTNLSQPILTSYPITKMVFQRGSDGGVYLGSKSGVFYKNNTMPNWVMLGNGLPMVEVRNMFINYNLGKLRLGTSRGAWEHNLYETSPPMAQISASTNLLTCAAQPVQFKDYSTVRNASATWAWSFPGGTPSSSTLENPVVSYSGQPNGKYSVSLTVTDAYGTSSQTLTDFIEVAATSVSLPFSLDFEGTFPPTNLSLSSTGNSWVQNTSVGGFGTSTKCASFVNYATGQDGKVASMTTAPINVTSAGWTGATLTFDQAYAQYPGKGDALSVSVSTDCGATYTEIFRKTAAELETVTAQGPYFTPTSAQWRKESIDISAYLGQVAQFKISFHSGGGNNMYLDNLSINQAFPITASSNVAGTISPTGVTYVTSGGSQKFTITTNSCQTLSQVLVNGVNNTAAVTAKSYTFTNVTTGTNTISAVFSNIKTWNGSAWSPTGNPTSTSQVVFTGNYTSAADLTACTMKVTNNAVVNIGSGYDVTLTGALTVESGSFTLNNNSNLVQTGTVNNSGNIIVKRNSAALKRLDYTLWSSPVSGQKLQAFSPTTFTNRFYTYNSTTNLFNAVASPSTTDFAIGTGYLIRMPDTHPTTATTWSGTFTGVPNNGTITIPVTSGTYVAVGNPFPSTISANTFFTTNGISEAIYFWRKTNGAAGTSYATYTRTGSVGTPGTGGITPNGTIQIGQGFIVKPTSSTITFNYGMRTNNNVGQFLKTKAIENNRIWLNLSKDAEPINQMMVAYMADATEGVDAAIDGKYYNDSPIALNSLINDEEYAIQAKGLPFQDSDIVPLAFKTTEAGNYSIAIDQVDGLFSNNPEIFLKDNLTGAEKNLKSGAYTFTSEVGTFNSRFQLNYKSQNALSIDAAELNANTLVVFKENGIVSINAGKTILKKVRVFDIRGALLFELKDINATTAVLKNFKTTHQTLVIQITSNDNKVISKKLVY